MHHVIRACNDAQGMSSPPNGIRHGGWGTSPLPRQAHARPCRAIAHADTREGSHTTFATCSRQSASCITPGVSKSKGTGKHRCHQHQHQKVLVCGFQNQTSLVFAAAGLPCRINSDSPNTITWVHSSVVRAADCRSAGPWFESGCALKVQIFIAAQCHTHQHLRTR